MSPSIQGDLSSISAEQDVIDELEATAQRLQVSQEERSEEEINTREFLNYTIYRINPKKPIVSKLTSSSIESLKRNNENIVFAFYNPENAYLSRQEKADCRRVEELIEQSGSMIFSSAEKADNFIRGKN